MKTLKTSFTALLLLTTLACNSGKNPPQNERVVEIQDPETGIISLRDYILNDTITIGGQLYHYSCAFESVDSMPVVINPQGLEYHESRVCIEIQRDSTKIFHKTFYKSNFRDMIPADFLKTSTMVGVNYNFTKCEEDHSAFYFIVTIGDPDETSDMAYPLELKVATDGTYSLKKAENLETAPITPGLNIDPSEDAV